MLRLMSVTKPLRTLLALPLLLLPACGESGADRSGQAEVGPLIYGVSYTGGAKNYDDAAAESAYEKCAELPGAMAEGTDDSLPPGRTLRFFGSASEQEAVADCLASLPGAKVNGPFEPPSE